MKKILLAGMIAAGASFSAHALNTGDLAFTSFNSQEDGWSMVALTAIGANTTLYFTDNEWNELAIGSGGTFNTGESYSKWVSGSSVIAAGTVIRFNSVDSATLLGASVGTFTRETVASSTNWGISQTADTVYAYQGSPTAPTSFIAAISSGGFTTAQGALTNTGLTVGVNATQLTNATTFAEYTGARAGQSTFGAYLPGVTNVANWNVSTATGFATTAPNVTAFTITPVPEADTWAMLLAGLGLIGFIGRRRSK